ncbi:uncharacterized protein LOC131995190 isoform X2 [Stomoxys calcitrans]|uniref:uncharacterized protein LOC131995190 isoform X2 n=1 Tax=Stomoxys calcitrans TaxID=35570 RepID=UPI0027E2F0D3|nr:uncharacterized protein LOC131995190 isoform X2 [Stomoxys calcitrans]
MSCARFLHPRCVPVVDLMKKAGMANGADSLSIVSLIMATGESSLATVGEIVNQIGKAYVNTSLTATLYTNNIFPACVLNLNILSNATPRYLTLDSTGLLTTLRG